MKQYAVYFSVLNGGCYTIEANTKEEAAEKFRELDTDEVMLIGVDERPDIEITNIEETENE